MFIELETPLFAIIGGKVKWFICPADKLNSDYLSAATGKLVAMPCFFDTIEEAWTAASEYCTSYDMVYPYALSSDGEIFKLGDNIIAAVGAFAKEIKQGSRVMEFEE